MRRLLAACAALLIATPLPVAASVVRPGAGDVVTLYAQTFGVGVKSFTDALRCNGGLRVGGSSAVTITGIFSSSTSSGNPGAVGAGTSKEATVSRTGLLLGDIITFGQPSAWPAGLGLGGMRVSATDQFAVRGVNTTAGSITSGTGSYAILYVRYQ